ncbi:MAG TPA: XcyI family restriction endonuclease [Chthonomonadaceae bacterium]|nr:XcyI family restriction endonuclease [Chthonomonadaceae bacterium]
MTSPTFKVPDASRQVAFHLLLVGARRTLLIDALSEAVSKIDPTALSAQLSQYAPRDARQILAGAGIRDEHVFPTPIVLETAPKLVGYYRLLLGVSQKVFYATGSGMGVFFSMEKNGTLNAKQRALLGDFCATMAAPLADLVRQISPTVTPRDINELPLLTLGSQFQGGNNNTIGKQATDDMFQSLIAAATPYVTEQRAKGLTVKNPAGQVFEIQLASDPDVAIQEITGSGKVPVVAIEIKGGTDQSNAHNRAGEAEKSHQKINDAGYGICWTIIHKKGLDMATLRRESPTTDRWFDIAQILAREGDDWTEFQQALDSALHIRRDTK